MSYVTPEDIAQAKQMDLLTYLQSYEPQELVRVSGNTYCTREHDSLKISNGLWCWWSRGIGGKTALDYLTQVRGLEFTEAVGRILRDSISSPAQSRSPPVPEAPKAFVLPEPNDNNRRVFAYLYSRGIDPEIINHCIKHGQLYEEREHHNAVFVGFDGNQPKFASMRSTLSDSTFLRDAEGSDKRFSFSFTASDCNGALVVSESAIDLLSYLTLMKRKHYDWREVNGVSLTGVYRPREDNLAVPAALAQYLKGHPYIRRIALCLDRDEAGREAAQGIITALSALDVSYRPPTIGKDYNDMLCAAKGIKINIRMRGEHER